MKLISLIFKQIEDSLLVGNGGREVDLLYEELRFFEIVSDAKQMMVQWGNNVNTFWLTSQKGELSIVTEMSKHLSGLFESIANLFEKNEKFEKAREYWNSFDVDE